VGCSAKFNVLGEDILRAICNFTADRQSMATDKYTVFNREVTAGPVSSRFSPA